MRRRVPATVHLLLLAVVLLIGVFQWGWATAAARFGERRRTEVVDAVRHAAPAVVSVEAWRSNRRTRGEGSGVIVHPGGYVVTNSHVIRGASRITVQLWQSKTIVDASVVANDPGGDLALLKLRGNRRWPYASLAPTSHVIAGETAIAIGNPRGLGDSITVGVVSAVRRSAKVASGGTIKNLIQTDASINTGNSGGPLLNLEGELIGINTSILPRASGIAFAIPADEVQRMLMRALGHVAPRKPLAPGETTRARPPVAPPVPPPAPTPEPRVREPEVARRAPDDGGESENERGEIVPLRPEDLGLTIRDDGCRLVVRKVKRGSPAATAGMLPGDVLLEIDGLPVEDLDDVVLVFQASRPGRRYEINGRRGDHEIYALLVSPR